MHYSLAENVASSPPIRNLQAQDPVVRNIVRRFFGYVSGIRPTLLAQTGLGTVGADHLSRDGRVAWRVALESLAGDAGVEATRRHRNGECSRLLDQLSEWIHLELQLETLRWQPAEMTLRHLHYVLTADGPMRRQDERCVLLGIWGATLHDLILDLHTGEATLGRQGPSLVAQLDTLADNCDEADLVRDHLATLAQLADADTPSPMTYPLVPPCSRNDLRYLLDASSPPPLGPS